MPRQSTSRVFLLCATCGEEFSVIPYRAERARFCSRQCRLSSGLPRKPLTDRFFAKVDKGGEDECWEWTGARNHTRYGHIFADGKIQLAHRVSWEMHNGPIPEGLLVCHTCDNPPCVNPAHLFLGTSADNAQDCAAKGRTNKPRGDENPSRKYPGIHLHGESHPDAKLTEEIVREIRIRYAAGGVGHRALAVEYGVSRASITRVISRITWKHVT